ncbi:MAG: magnesium transporter [Planctomycetaceae bacterium]
MQPFESAFNTFAELHPDDASRVVETFSVGDAQQLLDSLPEHQRVSLLERLSLDKAMPLIVAMSVDRAAEVLAEMSPRSAAAILKQAKEDERAAILEAVPASSRRTLQQLVEFPDDCAGGMMEPRVAALSIDLNVQQAIARLRSTPREALHYLYVTDRSQRLVGVLNMRDLLLANPTQQLEPMVRTNVFVIPDTMPREEVVNQMRERKFLAVPVVDFEGRLIGVVQHSEALKAGQLEGFEDLQRIVGAGATERALSPVRVVVKNRLPWLLVNLVTAFMAAFVVGLFEGVISRVAALAVLLPVVAGQGGNTGSQSLAVVMRGVALREIIPGVSGRVVRKEVLGGLINGALISVVTAAAVLGWRLATGESLPDAGRLCVVIGSSMIVTMAMAALAGSVIPLILRALGRDPAQSASIFLTTATDIIGFGSFLGCAALLL